MTKRQWQRHYFETVAAGLPHDAVTCKQCAERLATKRRSRRAAARAQAMRDLGMTRTASGQWE